MPHKYEKPLVNEFTRNADQTNTVHDESSLSDEYEDAVAAIQEALDEIEAGDPRITFDEFDREFRQRQGIR